MQHSEVRRLSAQREWKTTSISIPITGTRILVAGADQTTCGRVCRILKTVGYEVSWESHLLKINQHLANKPPLVSGQRNFQPVELLIVDLGDQPRELLGVIEAARRCDWMIPIAVLLDRHVDKAIVREVKRIGAHAVFRKPVKVEAIKRWAFVKAPPYEAAATA